MPAITPLINGINYAAANVTVVLFGVPLIGILSIDYKAKQAKVNNYGFQVEPISRGYGIKEYEGAMEIYVDEWQRVIASAPNADPLQIPPFDIQVTFTGAGVLQTKHVLRSTEFMEDPLSTKSGDTRLTVTIPLIIGKVDKS